MRINFSTSLISVQTEHHKKFFNQVSSNVIKIVDDLNWSKRLVAQNFDGTAAMGGNLFGLQGMVKNK